jgi:hypothetical protein
MPLAGELPEALPDLVVGRGLGHREDGIEISRHRRVL